MPTFGITVRAPSAALETATTRLRPSFVETNGDECLAHFEFPGREVALFQLIAWGRSVTVVDPPDLVTDALALARDLLDRYSPATPAAQRPQPSPASAADGRDARRHRPSS
jgi:hypothetical protein